MRSSTWPSGPRRRTRRSTDRRAEAAERRLRRWYEATLGGIGDAVVAADADGRVRFLNAVAEALTGWSQDEAAGRPLEEVARRRADDARPGRSTLLARDGREVP